MNRCPNCNCENPPTSAFCGYCGASPAPTSSPLEPMHKVYDETPIPPPPPGYGVMPTLVAPQRWQSYAASRDLRQNHNSYIHEMAYDTMCLK